jgi:hypothetical protein
MDQENKIDQLERENRAFMSEIDYLKYFYFKFIIFLVKKSCIKCFKHIFLRIFKTLDVLQILVRRPFWRDIELALS